ncbi:hypothetical protein WG906_02520 [Pedobacter sp. P351]|uniref:hypothetical protein n=1 Tax=Pedobacter superstes TaxID=3133441 RepID=UPI0030967C19
MTFSNSGTYSQTRYLTKTIDIIVPTVLDLEVTSGANQVVDFNQTSKIDNGIELLSATILTYTSNKAWFITIKSGSSNFTGGMGGSPMPASVIKYRINGSGSPYVALSATEQALVATTGSKYPRGTGTTTIDFNVNPGYIYPPADNYSLQIIYTISNL